MPFINTNTRKVKLCLFKSSERGPIGKCYFFIVNSHFVILEKIRLTLALMSYIKGSQNIWHVPTFGNK